MAKAKARAEIRRGRREDARLRREEKKQKAREAGDLEEEEAKEDHDVAAAISSWGGGNMNLLQDKKRIAEIYKDANALQRRVSRLRFTSRHYGRLLRRFSLNVKEN